MQYRKMHVWKTPLRVVPDKIIAAAHNAQLWNMHKKIIYVIMCYDNKSVTDHTNDIKMISDKNNLWNIKNKKTNYDLSSPTLRLLYWKSCDRYQHYVK